jgi:FkbM family methyltransferase
MSDFDYTQAVIYRPKTDIAGVRPYFVLPSQDTADYFDSCGGAPEAELITWAHQFLNPYKSFIDIGSHIGTWSTTFALAGHYNTIAYEAQEWLAGLNSAGLALNGQVHVTCHNVGIWSEQDLLTLRAPHADGGGGSVAIDFGTLTTLTEKVPVYPLDLFAHQPGLIKIDVEGAELHVLKGAAKTITAEQPTILFESWRDERGQDIESTFRYLHDTLNYRSVNVTGWPEMYLAEPR